MADRYVNDSTGNDSWDGTAPTGSGPVGPWLTLTKAAAWINAGNAGGEVDVADGTYTGFRLLNQNASSGNRTIFLGTGSNVIIDVPEQEETGKPKNGIFIYNCDYTTINNFKIHAGNATDWPFLPGGGIGVYAMFSHYFEMLNCYTEETPRGGCDTSSSHHAHIFDNEFTRGGRGDTGEHLIYLAGTVDGHNDYSEVRRNIFHDSYNDCNPLHLNFRGQYVIFDSNLIYNNTQQVTLNGCKYCQVTNNIWRDALSAQGYQIWVGGENIWDKGHHDASQFNVIANNTFLQGPASSHACITFRGPSGTGTENAKDNYVFNNICIAAAGKPAFVGFTGDQYIDTGGSNIIGNEDTFNFAACFTDHANNDYTLKSGGPAHGVGLEEYFSNPAPTYDYIGSPRPGADNHFDSGAYEIIASTPEAVDAGCDEYREGSTNIFDGKLRLTDISDSLNPFDGKLELIYNEPPEIPGRGAVTVMPEEVSDQVLENMQRYTKAIDIRVLLWCNENGGPIPPQGHSEWAVDISGYYSAYYEQSPYYLNEWTWIKSAWALTASIDYDALTVSYEDKNGNIIPIQTVPVISGSTPVIFKYPIFTKKLYFRQFKTSDNSFTVVPWVHVYSDTFFDITEHIGGQILIEQNTAGFSDEIKLPFTSITLDNTTGIWNKGREFNLNKFFVERKSDEFRFTNLGLYSVTPYKASGTRITVEIKFLGDKFTDSDWVLLSNFYARKWTSSNISGESAWIAKTKIDTPLIEGEPLSTILERYIVRDDDGSIILQINEPPKDDEIITINSEKAGEVTFLSGTPDKVDPHPNVGIASHAFDGTYFYYAIDDQSGIGYDSFHGGGMEIWRVSVGGEREQLGWINGAVPKLYYNQLVNTYTFGVDNPSCVNGQTDFTRYMVHVFQMAVDDEYLYIPFTDYSRPKYPSYAVKCLVSGIYKFPKDGTGWPTFVSAGPGEISTYPTNIVENLSGPGNYGGYAGKINTNCFMYLNSILMTTIEVEERLEGDFQCFLGCELVKDINGDKKLLVMQKHKEHDDYTLDILMTSFRLIDINWGGTGNTYSGISNTSVGIPANDRLVVATMHINDNSAFAYYENSTGGHIGLLTRDSAGTYSFDTRIVEIDLAGDDPLQITSIMAMCQYKNGIYISGQNYEWQYEWNSVTPLGISQLINNVFHLQGYNISHYKNTEFNNFQANPVPIITVGGNDLHAEIVLYGSSSITDNVLITPGYSLNLKTGELVLFGLSYSGVSSEVLASYDFTLSAQFYKAEGDSRLSSSVLGQLQQATSKTYFINEAGILEKLPLLESQSIPIRHVVEEYSFTESANPSTNPEDEIAIQITVAGGSTIRYTALEFTPAYNGTLDKVKIPFRLYKTSTASGTIDATVWNIYVANDDTTDIDLSRTGTNDVVEAPTTANIDELRTSVILKINAQNLYTNSASDEETFFYWQTIDVSSAGFEVTADQVYCIILEQATAFTAGWSWEIHGKETDKGTPIGFANTIAYQDQAAWPPVKVDWDTYDTNLEVVPLFEVEVKKSSQVLKSNDIIDVTNPNISSGFNSIAGGNNSTVAVYSDDFNTKYTRGIEYDINYTDGNMTIDSLNIDINKSIIVQWYESIKDLMLISDSADTGIKTLEESSRHGDDFFLRTRVVGKRKRPSDVLVGINKSFDLFPGINQDITSENEQIQNVEATEISTWNDNLGEFIPVDDTASETKTFAVDFKDPFIIGTTSYKVTEGMGSSTDNVLYGSLSSSGHGMNTFYEVPVSGFPSSQYHVMLKSRNYLEWRLAIVADFEAMTEGGGARTVGNPPSSIADIKTTEHFYLKHMNNNYGESFVEYIVYESRTVLYYVSSDGLVIQDDDFLADGNENPLHTTYKTKRIKVTFKPSDLIGNPLFPYHGTYNDGPYGYKSDYNSAVRGWMSGKIARATLKADGINARYDNYTGEKRFLEIEVRGYSITEILDLIAEVRNPGYEHADAKTLTIENDILQHKAIVDRLARSQNNFWKDERLNYNQTAVYHTLLRPGAIVKVKSELQGLDNALFVITNPRHSLGFGTGFTTSLGRLLQI